MRFLITGTCPTSRREKGSSSLILMLLVNRSSLRRVGLVTLTQLIEGRTFASVTDVDPFAASRWPATRGFEMDPLAQRLLWLGYEDASGLWEAEQEATLLPLIAAPTRRASVARTLQDLARRGLIDVCAGPEPLQLNDRTRVPISELAAVLEAPGSWLAPERQGDNAVRYETTDKGFTAYRSAVGWAES